MTRRLADRYVLGDRIARGGTARIHEAIDTRLDRRVAVKLLDQDLAETASPAGRDRFVQECRTSAGFTHPRAVTIFDAGEDGDDLFLVMELVDGPSLARHLADTGPLPLADVVRLSTQLADALGAAHDAGIVHRDVKPANVLLDHAGDAKLADFGIARRFDELDAAVTATGMVVGTPRYLAPEQATGGLVGPPADVYALGLVMVEMLLDRAPTDIDVDLLRRERPDLPEHLVTLLGRMRSHDPRERPANGHEVSSALRARSGPTSGGPVAAMTDTSESATDTAEIPTTVWRAGDTAVMPEGPRPISTDSPSVARGRRRTRSHIGLVAPVIAATALVAILVVGSRSSDERTAIDPTTSAADAAAAPEDELADGSDEGAAALPDADDPSGTNGTNDVTLEDFAAIMDADAFARALAADPAIAGPAGGELADALRAVIETAPRPHQAEAAAALQDQVAAWVTDDLLDGGFAVLVDDLLAPIADHPSTRR